MMHRFSKSSISNNLEENMKRLKMALVLIFFKKKRLMAIKYKT